MVELVLLVVPFGRQTNVRIAPEVEAATVDVVPVLEADETPEVVPVVVHIVVPDDVVAPVVPLATEVAAVAAVVVERPVELLEAASLTSVFVAQQPLAATSPAQSSVCRPSIIRAPLSLTISVSQLTSPSGSCLSPSAVPNVGVARRKRGSLP